MPIRGRRNRRFVLEDSTVEYRRHSALSFLSGAPKVSPLIDMSVGGLQFVSDDLYEIGQRLNLKVIAPSAFRSLTAQGEVVWAKRVAHRGSYRMGVRFLSPTAEVVGFVRTLEERYWAAPDERKREMEAVVAQRFPLHLEPRAEGAPPRVYEDAVDVVEAPPAASVEAPAPPPPVVTAPAPPPTPDPEQVPAPEAPEPAAAAAAEPMRLLPSDETPLPTIEMPPGAKADAAAPVLPPQPEPVIEEPPRSPEPVALLLYDLVAAIETGPDARIQLRGVAKHQIILPGITDGDSFALEVHDNTMRHSGVPTFDRGDVVVFSPNVPARSGDLAFVITQDGGLFRQIFFDANNTVRLHPLNSWYPEQCCPREAVQGLWKLVAKFESYVGR